ncbi:MAG: glycosyltransferase [Cruoricaptor ignavus]|nr:glycosyltransferase [Cruoricaptor ignavus]
MAVLRNKISIFSQTYLSKIYNILYNIREWWRIKRGDVFPYKFKKERYPGLFLQHDYLPLPNIPSKIERVIYCHWTGDNEMSENRKKGYQSLVENSGVKVVLITPKNLHEFILDEYPLHPAYELLSLNHKSDYLRCYFAQFYGGGYCDIKPMKNSWIDSFNLLEEKDGWFLSYTQIKQHSVSKGQGIIDKDLKYYFKKCTGTGAFINKSNTQFTVEWWMELNRRLDENFELLEANPGIGLGKNKGYPLSLLSVSTQIMVPLNLKFLNKIIHDNRVLPELKNYQ